MASEENVPTMLDIAKISADDQVQCRKHLNKKVVREYSWRMAEGIAFPPIEVFHDEQRYLIADGFHRYHAAIEAGQLVISTHIHEGGIREAKLFAATANTKHGLRRTHADKRKAVNTVLMDEEWRSLSNGDIAKRLSVTPQFVGDVRRELEATRNDFESPTVRTGSDGRTINTKGIGKKRPNNLPVLYTPVSDSGKNEEYMTLVEVSALVARIRELEAKVKEREKRIFVLERVIAGLEEELVILRPPVPAPCGLVRHEAFMN